MRNTDLEPSVHFQKEERAGRVIDDKFDGA